MARSTTPHTPPAEAPTAPEQQLDAADATSATASADVQRAADKRRAAYGAAGNPQYVDALLAERRGYVIRGLDDRVTSVDAALDSLGYVADNA